jgi:hypothetical protein
MNMVIEFDEHGIRLHNRAAVGNGATMPWSAVRSIWMHKIDACTFDVLALVFCYGPEPSEVDIDVCEEAEGFKALLDEVSRRYALTGDWQNRVVVPAFAENLTRLWPPLDS